MRLEVDKLIWRKAANTWFLYYGGISPEYPLAAVCDSSIAYNSSRSNGGGITSHSLEIPTDPKELEELLELWKTLIVMQWEG